MKKIKFEGVYIRIYEYEDYRPSECNTPAVPDSGITTTNLATNANTPKIWTPFNESVEQTPGTMTPNGNRSYPLDKVGLGLQNFLASISKMFWSKLYLIVICIHMWPNYFVN